MGNCNKIHPSIYVSFSVPVLLYALGDTCLIKAVLREPLWRVEFLLIHGASVMETDNKGKIHIR